MEPVSEVTINNLLGGVKMLKRNMKLLLVAMLSVSILAAGCGKKKTEQTNTNTNTSDDKTPITFTFFDKNSGDPFNTVVAKEITKKTGVTLEMQQPTGNSTEKLNLMLASGDYPDMILMPRDSIVDKYVEAKAIIPLDDLIDKYGPNVKKMYGDLLKKLRSKDGKNYYLSNWYGVDPTPVLGMLMRMDLLKELGGGDKYQNGAPFTTDEFEGILKLFREKFPTIDGKQTLPLTLNGENMGSVLGTFKAMWGMKSYYDDNGVLKDEVRDPKYGEMLTYMNKLYRAGYIDKEWVANKQKLWEQKLTAGNVFATAGAWWDTGTPNAALKAKGLESQFYAYKVVAPGVDASKTTFSGRSALGWDAIAITKNCKDPVRAMKFFDFIVSEEGQYLGLWGVEGVHWDMVSGKHTPKKETLDAIAKDAGVFMKETGVRKTAYFVKNGKGSDGTPFDLVYGYKIDEIQAHAIKSLKDTNWDYSEFSNLTPAAGTPDALVATKLSEIKSAAIPKIIGAATQEESKSLYEKMLSDMKVAGEEKVRDIINKNYKERMTLWK